MFGICDVQGQALHKPENTVRNEAWLRTLAADRALA